MVRESTAQVVMVNRSLTSLRLVVEVILDSFQTTLDERRWSFDLASHPRRRIEGHEALK